MKVISSCYLNPLHLGELGLKFKFTTLVNLNPQQVIVDPIIHLNPVQIYPLTQKYASTLTPSKRSTKVKR